MLKKIVWEENGVFSLKLKDDLFTLVQMRQNSIMQFFDISKRENEWAGIDLNSVKTLFFIFAAEKNLKSLFVEKIDTKRVTPSCESIPKIMLSAVFGNNGVHGANLVELTPEYSSYGARVIKEGITAEQNIDLIYRYELAGMEGSPEKLKKRLLRYFDTGVNWDESKEFLFKNISPPPALKKMENDQRTGSST